MPNSNDAYCVCSDKFDLIKITRCNHESCKKCLVDYVTSNLSPRIKCPHSTCNHFIRDRQIRECLSNNQTEAYEGLSLANAISTVKKCPIKECSFIYSTEDDCGIFDCGYCGSPICIKCDDIHLPIDCGKNTADVRSLRNRALENIKAKLHSEVKENDLKYNLIPNPNSFECPICCGFFFPREGIILRNCLHCVCRKCLESTMKSARYINMIICPTNKCHKPLSYSETFELIGEVRLAEMMKTEASSRFFQCKNENCSGMWHVSNKISISPCPVCGKLNCAACEDIHENMSCEEFRTTKRYLASLGGVKILQQSEGVKCYMCLNLLIRKEGCSSLYCDRCGNHTCLFTGKIAGQHKAEMCYCNGASDCTKIKYYCGCSSAVPCHKDCKFGCYPEIH